MSDDIEKARAAHAALVAAKEACDAAGFAIEASTMMRGDALAQIIERAASHIASMERRAAPIALGDKVTVHGINDGRNGGPTRASVIRVDRTLIRLEDRREEYRIGNGHWNDRNYGSNYWIDPDDLFRIKRDLVGKRPPKPAPTLREVGTVTTAAKGDDE